MRKPLAVAAMVATGLLVPTAASAGRAPADLTLEPPAQVNDAWSYSGLISSPKKQCEDGRKVSVYRERNGKDEKLGSDKSAEWIVDPSQYVWQVEDFDEPEGVYYAKAPKTKKCKEAVSNSVGVAP